MTFNEWLQSRLVAHGYRIAVDGAIGGETKRALLRFQRRAGLEETGIADRETVAALRAAPGEPDAASAVTAETVPTETMPPWAAEMHRRMGLHEVRDNGILSAWLKAGRFLGNPARLPWCGDAIETCFAKTLPFEPVPNNPFFAQAWAKFGVSANGPKIWSVGVIRWSASSGHVGLVADHDPVRRRVRLLGGNQSNAVTLSWFPLAKFIAFRWPASYPFTKYPPLSAGVSSSGSEAGTR